MGITRGTQHSEFSGDTVIMIQENADAEALNAPVYETSAAAAGGGGSTILPLSKIRFYFAGPATVCVQPPTPTNALYPVSRICKPATASPGGNVVFVAEFDFPAGTVLVWKAEMPRGGPDPQIKMGQETALGAGEVRDVHVETPPAASGVFDILASTWGIIALGAAGAGLAYLSYRKK